MNIAVTGASGYLAGVLIPKLDALPEVESILALDIRPPGPALAGCRKVRFERGDVRTADFAGLLAGVDAVAHLAFILAPISDDRQIHDVNVSGSERVFAGAAAAGARRVVYASSLAAYGLFPDHPLPLRETTPLRDQTALYYAHTKFLVEQSLDRFEREHPGIAVARMRPGAIMGPSCVNPLAGLLGAPIVLGIAGMAALQFTWDEDVADAFVLALLRGARGPYIVTAEEPIALSEVARMLGRRYVAMPRFLAGAFSRAAAALGGGRTRHYRGWLDAARSSMHASGAKLRADLGWTPRFPTSRDVIRRLAETLPEGQRSGTEAGCDLLVRSMGRLAEKVPRPLRWFGQ